MLYTNMVVAVPGPPWVIRLISPNTLKELITDVMTIKKVVPESIGIVTYQIRASPFAPSMAAASYRSLDTLIIPERNRITV